MNKRMRGVLRKSRAGYEEDIHECQRSSVQCAHGPTTTVIIKRDALVSGKKEVGMINGMGKQKKYDRMKAGCP